MSKQAYFKYVCLFFYLLFIFFKFFKILFYLTLQYCIGFAIYQNESATGLLNFPCGSAGKESTCDSGDLGLILGLGQGKATHSSILAWRIPWNVQSMWLQRVRHD